ncbi:hypothetical protein VE02_01999 [Pseudogymnoascus sp. 03VT05]|nr:hypothetical protein VE02_01999 [Pseudogymnoascus sp. 03VT05]
MVFCPYYRQGLTLNIYCTDQESIAVVKWLSPLNFFVAQNDILRRRQIGTGEWLLKLPNSKRGWLGRTEYYGAQASLGQEKLSLRIISFQVALIALTVARSSIVNKLQIQQSSRDVGLAFAYCNYKEHDIQTLANLIGSLVQQLVQCYGAIPDEIRVLYTQYNSRNIRPSEDELSRALLSIISKFSHVYIVVDALDECNPKRGASLLGNCKSCQQVFVCYVLPGTLAISEKHLLMHPTSKSERSMQMWHYM